MEDHPWRNRTWASTLPPRWRDVHRYVHFFLTPSQDQDLPETDVQTPLQRALRSGTHLTGEDDETSPPIVDTQSVYQALEEVEQMLGELRYSTRVHFSSWINHVAHAVRMCCYEYDCSAVLTDTGIRALSALMDVSEMVFEETLLTNSEVTDVDPVKGADLIVRSVLRGLEILEERLVRASHQCKDSKLACKPRGRIPCSIEDTRTVMISHLLNLCYLCVSSLAFASSNSRGDEFLRACVSAILDDALEFLQRCLARSWQTRGSKEDDDIHVCVCASRETLIAETMWKQSRILQKSSQKSYFASIGFHHFFKVIENFVLMLSPLEPTFGDIREADTSAEQSKSPILPQVFKSIIRSNRSQKLSDIQKPVSVSIIETLEKVFDIICAKDQVPQGVLTLLRRDCGTVHGVVRALVNKTREKLLSEETFSFYSWVRLCTSCVALHSYLSSKQHFWYGEIAECCSALLHKLSHPPDSPKLEQKYLQVWEHVFRQFETRMNNISWKDTFEYARLLVMLASSTVYENFIKGTHSLRLKKGYSNLLNKFCQTVLGSLKFNLNVIWKFCSETAVQQLILISDIFVACIVSTGNPASVTQLAWAVNCELHQSFPKLGASRSIRFLRVAAALANFSDSKGSTNRHMKTLRNLFEDEIGSGTLSTFWLLGEFARMTPDTADSFSTLQHKLVESQNDTSVQYILDLVDSMVTSHAIDVTTEERILRCLSSMEYLCTFDSNRIIEDYSALSTLAVLEKCVNFTVDKSTSLEQALIDRLLSTTLLLIYRILRHPPLQTENTRMTTFRILEEVQSCNSLFTPFGEATFVAVLLQLALVDVWSEQNAKVNEGIYYGYQKLFENISTTFKSNGFAVEIACSPVQFASTDSQVENEESLPSRHGMDHLSYHLDCLSRNPDEDMLAATLSRIELFFRFGPEEKISKAQVDQLLRICSLILYHSGHSRRDMDITNLVFRLLESLISSPGMPRGVYSEHLWNYIVETVYCKFVPWLFGTEAHGKNVYSSLHSAFYLRRLLMSMFPLCPLGLLRAALCLQVDMAELLLLKSHLEFMPLLRLELVPFVSLLYKHLVSTDEHRQRWCRQLELDVLKSKDSDGGQFRYRMSRIGLHILSDSGLAGEFATMACVIYLGCPLSIVALNCLERNTADHSAQECNTITIEDSELMKVNSVEVCDSFKNSISSFDAIHLVDQLITILHASCNDPRELMGRTSHIYGKLGSPGYFFDDLSFRTLVRLRTGTEILLLKYLAYINTHQDLDDHWIGLRLSSLYSVLCKDEYLFPLFSYMNLILGKHLLTNPLRNVVSSRGRLLCSTAASAPTLEAWKFLAFVDIVDVDCKPGFSSIAVLKPLLRLVEMICRYVMSSEFTEQVEPPLSKLLYPSSGIMLGGYNDAILNDRVTCIRYLLQVAHTVLNILQNSSVARLWMWNQNRWCSIQKMVSVADLAIDECRGTLTFFPPFSISLVAAISASFCVEILRPQFKAAANVVTDWIANFALERSIYSWKSFSVGVQLRLMLQTEFPAMELAEKLYKYRYQNKSTFLRNSLDRMHTLVEHTEGLSFELKAFRVERRYAPKRIAELFSDLEGLHSFEQYEFRGWTKILINVIEHIPSVCSTILKKLQFMLHRLEDNLQRESNASILVDIMCLLGAMGAHSASAKLVAGDKSLSFCIDAFKRLPLKEELSASMYESISRIVAHRESASFFTEAIGQPTFIEEDAFHHRSARIRLCACKCLRVLLGNSKKARAILRNSLSEFASGRANTSKLPEEDSKILQELETVHQEMLPLLSVEACDS